MINATIESAKQVGVGFRRPHLSEIKITPPNSLDFFELAPENWMGIGGTRKEELNYLADHYPLVCHGLSLSLGGIAPLDIAFLKQVKKFLDNYHIGIYSEHLSYCTDQAQLYDLLPIPFTTDAVRYVVNRIKQVQDIIEKPFAIENISYYLLAGNEMSEVDFINSIIAESQCLMLLDVNNIYVNSVNHQYDPYEFIDKLHPNKIAYIHVAGHHQSAPDLIIDTHAADIIDPVWDLLAYAYQKFGVAPTLIERDNNFSSFKEMLLEVDKVKSIQSRFDE